MLRFMVVAVLGLAGGCIRPQDVRQLAGFTEPLVEMTGPAPTGKGKIKFKASSDAAVVAKLYYPDGKVAFEIDGSSDAAGVRRAQGEAAKSLEPLRETESERMVAQQKLMNDLYAGMFGSLIKGVIEAIPLFPKPETKPTPTPGSATSPFPFHFGGVP